MAHSIKRQMLVEELIEQFPDTVKFMVSRGLPCFVCGEPTWGTFEQMARRNGKSDPEIDVLINEMQSLVKEHAA